MRNFRNLSIWQESIEQVVATYKLTAQFPQEEKFGLTSQMQRAAVSVSSNISEGCSRNSDIEFKRFLEIAIGSAFELETQTIIAHKLGYINENLLTTQLKNLHQLQKQINSLIEKIKSDL
jgi:four helix bundle protein